MAYVNPELLRGLPYDAKQNFQQKPQALSQELLNQPQNNLNVQNFKENYPLISPRDFRMQNQIYEQKLLYDNAQKAYANATDDADKIKYRQIMEDTATNANLLRENAQQLGLDTTGFGADDSFGDAVQRVNYNRNRGTFDIMDMPSTTAQKREVLFNLVRQGTAPHVAREVAEMFHDEFREENIRKLNEGIMSYGLNPDGSLNDFGGMMLRKLAYESPNDAEHIAQSYAAPKDLFGVNAQINLANLNNQAAWDRELERLKSAQYLAALSEAGKNARQESSQNFDWNKLTAQEEGKNARKTADMQMELLKINQKTPMAQYAQLYELGMELYGGDKTKAGVFAMEHFGKDSNGKNIMPSKGTFNAYSSILNDILSGDDETAREKYNNINARKTEDTLKFFDGWDNEQVGIESEYSRALEEFFTTEFTYTNDEDLKAQRNKALQRLQDKIAAIGSGHTADEFRQARQNAEHHQKDKQPENRTDTENKKVRDILDDNKDSGGLGDYFGDYGYGYGVKPNYNGGYNYGRN